MTAIQFGCPWCGAVSEVDSALTGQQVFCPACNALLIVPAVPARTAAPEPSLPPPPTFEDARLSPPPPPVPPSAVAAPASKSPPLPAAPHVSPVDVGAVSRVDEPRQAPAEDAPRVAAAAPPTDREIAQRELTPKEKARRRARRNLVMLACGLLVLLGALALLLWLSGS